LRIDIPVILIRLNLEIGGGYESHLYYLLTPEKKIELKNNQARRKLESVFIDQCGKDVYATVRRLTDSQLSRIVEILEEK
jgi:hypothetical protein